MPFFTIILLFFATSVFAEVPVNGFSEVGFDYVDNDDSVNNSGIRSNQNNFFHGGIDFYYTNKIDDKTNFLAEVVFEMGGDNTAVLDPERLWIQYHFSPLLKIKVGRVHTALGYWNSAFHHGSWLQTRIKRPLMYLFEDDGGILPVHSSGVEFNGGGKLGPGELNYVFNLANGRGPEVDPPQIVSDANSDKAYNLLLYYTVDKLRLGMTYYVDKMPGLDNGASTLVNKGDENIYGAHLIYDDDSFEFISEILTVNHKYKTGESKASVMGAYAQLSYGWSEKLRPYICYDTIKADKVADSYTSVSATTTQFTLGLRQDLGYASALKYEIESNKFSGLQTNTFRVNWSFTW